MQLWPFKKRQADKTSPSELRDRLVAAASGNKSKLRTLCEQSKDQVAANLDLMGKVPEEIRTDASAVEQYVRAITAVATCLAQECGAPELLNRLTGSGGGNPLQSWEEWFRRIPDRKNQLEYDQLIQEAKELLQQVQAFLGEGARQTEIALYGQLGDLLFHSGKVDQAEPVFRTALDLCREGNDLEGQRTYLANLFEVQRYLGDLKEAVDTGEQLLHLTSDEDGQRERLKKHLDRVRKVEPLCRVNCIHNGQEWEIDEIQSVEDGHYEFQFRRNRLSLKMCSDLVQLGNELGSQGKLNEALERFAQASQVDPLDPDPVYQTAVCLMELGQYKEARAAFDEVERLAPGWFRCRSDQWLSTAVSEGTVSDKEFRILRLMEDGGVSSEEIIRVLPQMILNYPNFAPLYLILGDSYCEQNEVSKAILCYRKGLELVAEPDLESRLLCAAAALLPLDSPERASFFDRIMGLKGSLVAQATARLMRLKR